MDPQHATRLDLQKLHDEYVELVNLAVAEGRQDLVRVLVHRFTTEALRAITDDSPAA